MWTKDPCLSGVFYHSVPLCSNEFPLHLLYGAFRQGDYCFSVETQGTMVHLWCMIHLKAGCHQPYTIRGTRSCSDCELASHCHHGFGKSYQSGQTLCKTLHSHYSQVWELYGLNVRHSACRKCQSAVPATGGTYPQTPADLATAEGVRHSTLNSNCYLFYHAVGCVFSLLVSCLAATMKWKRDFREVNARIAAASQFIGLVGF